MADFQAEYRHEKVAIRLPARVDVTNTRAFVDAIQRELDDDRLHIILNLEDTQAIDSTALGAIVQVFKTLKTRDGSLSLCAVGVGVRRVLAITRIDRVFPVYEDLQAAYTQGEGP